VALKPLFGKDGKGKISGGMRRGIMWRISNSGY
jgi:hypothetical protein